MNFKSGIFFQNYGCNYYGVAIISWNTVFILLKSITLFLVLERQDFFYSINKNFIKTILKIN